MYRLAGVCVVVAALAGCQSPPQKSQDVGRVDMDKDDIVGGTGTESGDVRAMSDQFVRSMMDNPAIKDAKGVPMIALISVDNRVSDVSQRIDTDMLLVRMRATLNKTANGKIRFLDRTNMEAIKKEHAAKDAGDVTRSSKRAIKGADFFMTGEVRSLTKTSGAGKSTYLIYAFRLSDAESSEIVWEDLYEQKRVGARGTVYQ